MKDCPKERHYLDDLCLGCRHTWEEHFVNHKNKQIWCGKDVPIRGYLAMCPCKNFQLDNLRHVEILAEERKLI
jgi:hypothetical protein